MGKVKELAQELGATDVVFVPANFHLALVECQKKIGAITKDAENPFFKSKYADINAFLRVIKPILNEHNLLLTQTHFTDQYGDFAVAVHIVNPANIFVSHTEIRCATSFEVDDGWI